MSRCNKRKKNKRHDQNANFMVNCRCWPFLRHNQHLLMTRHWQWILPMLYSCLHAISLNWLLHIIPGYKDERYHKNDWKEILCISNKVTAISCFLYWSSLVIRIVWCLYICIWSVTSHHGQGYHDGQMTPWQRGALSLVGIVEILLSLVESFIELKYFHNVATPALWCHKEPNQSP